MEIVNNKLSVTVAQIETQQDLSRLKNSLFQAFKKASLEKSNLIVFPELFNTPFLINDMKESSKTAREIQDWVQDFCKTFNLYCVAGSLALEEGGNLYNRCVIIGSSGRILGFYDKIHLLQVHSRHTFDENDVFFSGDHLFSFNIGQWKIGILLCYDIRFPELARAYEGGIDLLIVPAAFNQAVGTKHWRPILQTRAIENQFFVIGVNPAFKDYGSYQSYGHSMIVNPDGKILLELDGKENVETIQIDIQDVSKIRKRSPYYKIRNEQLYEKLKRRDHEKNRD